MSDEERKRSSDSLPKFVVRMNEELHERVSELSRYNRRSMNAEILSALEDRVEVEEIRREMRIKDRAFTDRIFRLEQALKELLETDPTSDHFEIAKSKGSLVL
ncbi:Arc family DNA-binding protein [Pseudomonas luteola]